MSLRTTRSTQRSATAGAEQEGSGEDEQAITAPSPQEEGEESDVSTDEETLMVRLAVAEKAVRKQRLRQKVAEALENA